MDREAETGEAVSCAVSLDGVPLGPDGDGEARWTSSGTVSGADGTRLKTLSFGPETGKTTALLDAEVAHVRKVRPDAGRCRRRRARQLDVSREARRTGNRLLSRLRTSRRSCRPSRPTGTTAPPCVTPASTRSAIRYLRDKATTKTAVLERELRFFRKHRRRLREPQGQGLRLRRRRSSEQGTGQPTHEAGALERRRRPERPHLQGDVGPLRCRVATGTGGANDSLNAA